MKHCPACNNSYPTSFRVCPQDNTPLRQTNEIEPGMVIRSKYQILEHLGGGGMADVYRAKHLAFDEIYAIKVVKASFADDTAFNNRFKSEAILTRKLRHPNAIAVEDYDTTEDGRPYIVMELVTGRNLRTVIDQEGALPAKRTLSLALQVARALSAAHKLGITHRDIKPNNILVTQDAQGNEVAKVLDFGIARVKEGAFTMSAYTATRQGMVVGTPQYMSPEQARGKVGDEIDGRADIYSLGVVIYEMITGKLPFESDTPMGYCLEHLNTMPVPPREFAAGLNIPVGLNKLVMKALEKDREKRFSTIDEMIEALQDPERWGAMAQPVAATIVSRSRVDETIRSAPPPDSARGQAYPATPPSPPARDRARVVYRPAQASVAAAAPARAQEQPMAASPDSSGRKKSSAKLITFALVVVLAAGAGAYFWMSKKPPAVVPPSRTQPVSDASLVNSVSGQLQQAPNLKSAKISVAAANGVVTLTGTADSAANREEAAKTAAAVQGVTQVVNSLVVQALPPDMASKVQTESQPKPVKPQPAQQPARVSPQSLGAAEAKRQARELLAVAQVQMTRADYASAISSYQQAVRLDPSNAAANAGLKKARQAKAQESVPPKPLVSEGSDDKRRARELVTMGQQQIDSGNYAMAVRTFQQAVRLDPSNPTAQAGLKKAQQAKRTEDDILQRHR
jgi:serine/threonine-protein kinase